MNCIIVDDEKKAISIIERYLKDFPAIKIAGTFRNAIDALSFLHSNQVDLIFLDINMPEVTGLEMLKTLPYQPQVILTTAYSEYALESYEYGVVDYLLKPISLPRFLKAINRVVHNFDNDDSVSTETLKNSESIVIKQDGTIYNISLDDLFVCEAYGNYVKLHTIEKIHLVRSKLNEIQQKLPDSFIQVHRSFIISLSKIEKVKGNIIHIKDLEIKIGQYYKADFLKAFQ